LMTVTDTSGKPRFRIQKETRGITTGLSKWSQGEPGSGATAAEPSVAPFAVSPPGAAGWPVGRPPEGRGTTLVGISAVLLLEQPDTNRQAAKPSQTVQPHCERIIDTLENASP